MSIVHRTSLVFGLVLVPSCATTPAEPPPSPVVVSAPPSSSDTPAPPSPLASTAQTAPTPAPEPVSDFKVPATKPGAKGWDEYVDPPAFDGKNVAGVFPGASSPEAAVVHYLASRIRKDKRYTEVMTADCPPRCAKKLADHDTWTFRSFRLVGRKTAPSGQEIWIKVWFEIEYDGKVDGGEDGFTVIEEEGAFRILYVPT